MRWTSVLECWIESRESSDEAGGIRDSGVRVADLICVAKDGSGKGRRGHYLQWLACRRQLSDGQLQNWPRIGQAHFSGLR
jgi:hypothetical protein